VNGEKKYITGGMKADYFTVAVRTGGKGMTGISLLLIERSREGIKCRRQKTMGWNTSTTTYISLENVRVPVNNLIGKEGQGFLAIMLNFNHERFTMCSSSIRGARGCVEEAIKWAKKRKTFGKPLINNQGFKIIISITVHSRAV